MYWTKKWNKRHETGVTQSIMWPLTSVSAQLSYPTITYYIIYVKGYNPSISLQVNDWHTIKKTLIVFLTYNGSTKNHDHIYAT